MAFTFEFEDGAVRTWDLTDDGATPAVTDYTPSLFVDAPERTLEAFAVRLEADSSVRKTAFVDRYTSFRDTKSSRVLRVTLEGHAEIWTLAREIRGVAGSRPTGCERERGDGGPLEGVRPPTSGALRLSDVTLTPGFRYCLDEGIDPTPSRDLRTLRIEIDERSLAVGDVSELRLDGEFVRGAPADVCWSIGRRLERRDPDVLVLSHADLVPVLYGAATGAGLEGFHLGRLPGWTRAGTNTGGRDGWAGHSPAGYRVPGRVIVDESSSTPWRRLGLEGLVYVVRRTGCPLQEATWETAETLLTSRQIRLARDQDVLVPPGLEPQSSEDGSPLDAVAGTVTPTPKSALRGDVLELEFAALLPLIVCQHNLSPETVNCACCVDDGGRERVPGLEYHVCREDGFLPGVVRPLLNDRAKVSRERRADSEDSSARRLHAKSKAVEWLLESWVDTRSSRTVESDGNECDEAISAYANDAVERSRARLEGAGWQVVRGVTDRLWVTPRRSDAPSLADVIDTISREIGVRLECEELNE